MIPVHEGIISKEIGYVNLQRDYFLYHNRDMSELKDRLKEARLEANLSQAKLAKLAGLKNQSNIGNLENGHRKTTTYIVQLAKVLNVEPLWLDKGEGPKSRQNEDKKMSDELSDFLGIPKSLCTLELAEQLQSFARATEEHRNKALEHIQEVKKSRGKDSGKGK